MKKFLKSFVAISLAAILTLAISYYSPAGVVNAAEDEKPAMNVEYRSKADIINYYNQHPCDFNMKTQYDEEPSVTQPYNPGKISSATAENANEVLNLIRYTAGLSGMTHVNYDYNEYAQAGALCNKINNMLSHYPSRPEGMSDELYNMAKEGASTSNIAYASWNFTLPKTLKLYMDDGNSGNVSRVGHRRWLLYPQLSGVGFGQVYNYSATKVIGSDRNRDAKEYGVAWPAQNTPIELLKSYDGYPWSISFGKNVPDTVKVRLTDIGTGKVWNFSQDYSDGEFYINNGGYGQTGCVIFVPDGLKLTKGSNFKVEISDIGIDGYSDNLSYNVSIFSLSDKNGIYYEDGSWNYYVDNNIDYNYTGLSYNETGWWYIENGRVNFDYNDIFYDPVYGWWKITNGYVDFDCNDICYSPTYGWWKITNGYVDFDCNDICYSPTYGWWKITNGYVDFDCNDICYSPTYGWWKITNGYVDFDCNDICYSPTYGWWKITNGYVDFVYNDICYSPTYGWWKITNGYVDFVYNGVYDSPIYGTWKISNGAVVFE